MKQTVLDKTERLEMGNIIELRGNFVEIPATEDGDTSYECDCYRTTNPNATFKQLNEKDLLIQLHQLLDSTDWVYAKCAELGLDAEVEYRNLVADRKEARRLIREYEQTPNI